jgi:hypothetical protein
MEVVSYFCLKFWQMATLEQRIKAFTELGRNLKEYSEKKYPEALEIAIRSAYEQNNWFIPKNIKYAFSSIANMLDDEKMKFWISRYSKKSLEPKRSKKVLVVMAGNIPMVGFHDFLCILISGNHFIGKLSSDDKVLLPVLSKMLIDIEPSFADAIHFVEGKPENFDAIIATGSDNSSRYFEYYFGKYPHIIRKNRNSIAVITGNENSKDLTGFADDVCLYFGLGCRNVSKIFIPAGYDVRQLFPAFQKYENILFQHNKHMNNFEYNSSVFMLNQIPFIENGFMLFTENMQLSSPISVVHYEYYDKIEKVNSFIKDNRDKLQCIVGNAVDIKSNVYFGKSQQPDLWEYADGLDTMDFLTGR